MTTDRIHLQPWYDTWLKEHREPPTDLLFVSRNQRGEPSLEQVHFVRDHLAMVVWADRKYEDMPLAPPREDCKESAIVVGEYRSKSVRLPVFGFDRPDLGVRLTLRYNFHDWNISVETEREVRVDLTGFPDDIDYCFFQGFPPERCFGPFSQNRKRFSTYTGTHYQIYTLVWLLMRDARTP